MNEQFSAFLDNEATRDEADAVVNALLRDDALRESWSRQHWLRTTLRAHASETAVSPDPDFASRVMDAIGADTHDNDAADMPVTPATFRPPHATMAGGRRRRWRTRAASVAAVASVASVAFLVSSPFQRSGTSGEAVSDTVASTTEASAGGQSMVDSANSASLVPTFETGSKLASGFMKSPHQARSLSSSRPSNLTRGLDIASVAPSQQVLSNTTGSARPVAETQTVNQGPAGHWSVSDPGLRDELNGYLVDHNGMARGYGLSGTTPALVRVATYGQETAQ